MKYSVGQKVKIRSLEWYRDNINRYGIIECGKYEFFEPMNEYCGKVVTIKRIDDDNYRIDTDKGAFCWTDEMIEGLVEEENKPFTYEETVEIIKTMQGIGDSWECPDGYIFVDENGNVINATKIVLEKKKKEYPKTYDECCEVLGIGSYFEPEIRNATTEECHKFTKLIRLKRCRDAYWKLYGEEMGLGKPWEPDWNHLSDKWVLFYTSNRVGFQVAQTRHSVFAFPTEEMRDAFKENFDSDIEICKEFL